MLTARRCSQGLAAAAGSAVCQQMTACATVHTGLLLRIKDRLSMHMEAGMVRQSHGHCQEVRPGAGCSSWQWTVAGAQSMPST